jgi:DNA polymerase III delta prime subunit
MQDERLNNLLLFIGSQGCGKTTIAHLFAKQFLQINSINKHIVVDTDAHPFYNKYDVVDLEGLAGANSQLVRCEDANDSDLFEILNTYQRNAFITFEDAAKYVSSNISRSLKKCIIDKRKRNFDLAFMFHTLKDVPPYIASNYQAMILFKTGDNFNDKQNKFNNWHLIKEKGLALQKSKNHHASTVIKM